MRAPVLLLTALLSIGLGACWQDEPGATAKLKLKPVEPLKDWTLIASHGDGKSSDAANDETATAPEARATPDAPGAKPAKARPRGRIGKSPKDTLSGGHEDAQAHTPRRHALYTRLAKDALMVIHVADLARLPEALKSSELGRLYEGDELKGAAQQIRDVVDNGMTQIRAQASEIGQVLDLLPKLGGELAISISGLTPESIGAMPTGSSWVVTIVYDAGAQSDLVAQFSAPLFATLAEKRHWSLAEKAEPAWGCEMGDPQFLLDFERREGLFELRFGGRAAVARELIASRKRAEANSFYSARVAADSASVEALGAKPVLEAHLQLASLWEAIRANGNRADQRVLARTGLTQFHGASMAVGKTERGLAEALTLHSPAGVDLITHALCGEPLDVSLARAIPADLANAGLYSFDGTRLIPDLCLLIPSQGQSALVRGIAECRRQIGIDLEKDVLGVFGPTIAFASDGWDSDPDVTGKFPPAFLACQVRDAARAQGTLDALLIYADKSSDVSDQRIDGTRVSSLTFPLESVGAEMELHWCFQDNVLLMSTKLELLRDAMHGLRGQEVRNAGIRRVLPGAGDGCFAAGFTLGDARTPDSLIYGRRTAAGLELTSADGNAIQSTIVSMFFAGMASSLAIPTLLKLRLEADEKAAKASLIVVNDAQIMARMNAVLDEDGDGRGECLFLPELCGAVPLRGGTKTLEEPWLDGNFEWVAPGVGVKSGYRYRIDLRLADGGSASSAEELGDGRVAIDAVEEDFVAYAWPKEAATGSTVFVFDSLSGLYSSDNRAATQRYCGERAPGKDAHCPAQDFPSDATRYVGRDGGIWLRLRGQ